MPGSAFTTSSRRSETATLNTIVLRLTFAGEVSAESVIQHLLETFNEDGSLVDAVLVPSTNTAGR